MIFLSAIEILRNSGLWRTEVEQRFLHDFLILQFTISLKNGKFKFRANDPG